MRTRQPCGTRAAYRRHLNAGEQPCDACIEANTIWQQGHEDRRTTLHPCPGCGVQTRARRLCATCRDTLEIGLYDGDWVQQGGIKVWVPWRVEEVA